MVETKKVSMALVSFSSKYFCNAINEKLISLGYQNIDVFRYDDLPSTQIEHSNSVYVFPLSSSKSLRRKMHRVLKKTKEKPLLSVIQNLENNSNINLLDYSDEFLC